MSSIVDQQLRHLRDTARLTAEQHPSLFEDGSGTLEAKGPWYFFASVRITHCFDRNGLRESLAIRRLTLWSDTWLGSDGVLYDSRFQQLEVSCLTEDQIYLILDRLQAIKLK